MNFLTWLFKVAVCIVLIFSGFYLYSRFGIGSPLVSVFSNPDSWMVVSGEGKVSLVPDMGLVNIGARSVHEKVNKAQEEANRIMNSVVGALKKIGIEEKDIKTSSYSIFPSYDWSAKRRFLGYEANIALSVTVRSLDKVDEVIDAATAKGANTVGEVRLIAGEEKERIHRQKARELAVNAAKEKADQLSQAAGMPLSRGHQGVTQGVKYSLFTFAALW